VKRETPRKNLLLTYSLTYLLINLLTYLITNLLTYLLTYLLTRSTEQRHSWQARNSPNYMEPESSLPH